MLPFLLVIVFVCKFVVDSCSITNGATTTVTLNSFSALFLFTSSTDALTLYSPSIFVSIAL